MIDLSQCRPARLLPTSVAGAAKRHIARAKYREARDLTAAKLIVAVATLDRFSNSDMTLKK